MNRLIVAIGLIVCASFNAQGQGVGTFEFMNVGVPDARQIYVDEYLTGPKASDVGYQIAVFWGPAGTVDENALVQLGASTGFLTGPGAGQFNGGGRMIFALTEDGGVAAFQARAWDASTGDTTWEQAAANPAGRIGKGPIFDMKTKDPSDFGEPLPRLGYATGWQGFAITPVPEPSTLALAALGIGGLLFLRRRR